MLKSKRQKELDFGIKQYGKLMNLSPVQKDLFSGFVRRMFFSGKEEGIALSKVLEEYILKQRKFHDDRKGSEKNLQEKVSRLRKDSKS